MANDNKSGIKEYDIASLEDLRKVAKEIAGKLKPGDVLALYGKLGAGKTTFTRFLVEHLGIDARVQSPTFIIARKYVSNGSKGEIKVINHVDLYRFVSSRDLADLDLEELFLEPASVTVIEWPEIAKDYLPENTMHIKFDIVGDDIRHITVRNIH